MLLSENLTFQKLALPEKNVFKMLLYEECSHLANIMEFISQYFLIFMFQNRPILGSVAYRSVAYKKACIRKTESPMKAVTVDIFRECIAKFLDTFRHVSLNALFFLEDEKDKFSYLHIHSRMRIIEHTKSVFWNLVTRS